MWMLNRPLLLLLLLSSRVRCYISRGEDDREGDGGGSGEYKDSVLKASILAMITEVKQR